jgi:hypothetical protein
MKKIILAFEGANFPSGAFEFARRVNELQPVLLTGVFLPQAQLINLWNYAGSPRDQFTPLIESDESALVQQNIERFEKLCQGNGIDYRVHKDFYDFIITELKVESRYADLMIIGSEVFYKEADTPFPNEYLREVLNDMACPVLLVPEKFNFPESIIMAYDGSEDAVFAIKQFAYLFPEFNSLQTLLVYANEDAGEDFPDKILIEELAARHFNNLTLFKLDINPKKHFSTWISENKSALLVCGSYGRPGLSQLLKKSFVKNIIADHLLPVFIAHR